MSEVTIWSMPFVTSFMLLMPRYALTKKKKHVEVIEFRIYRILHYHQIIGETGDNCNTGHVVTGDPTPRENDLRWLF